MKNFNEIYQKICEENSNTFNTENNFSKFDHSQLVKILTLIFEILPIILFFLLIIFKDYIENIPAPLTLIIMFSPILSVFLLSHNKKEPKKNSYSKNYKETIISSLLKNYDPNLQFDTIASITKNAYDNAEFENSYIFSSNDSIYGKIDGTIPIKISDIHTETKDNTTIFQGLFSIVYLSKNIQSTTLIRKDYAPTQSLKENMDFIYMDSQEFENYFDIFTNNKNMSMRFLTADIMNFMINFKNKNSVKFEITIKDTFAYIRIACNDMFEAISAKDPLNYNTLYTYYKYLDFICELSKKIFNTIEEKDL